MVSGLLLTTAAGYCSAGTGVGIAFGERWNAVQPVSALRWPAMPPWQRSVCDLHFSAADYLHSAMAAGGHDQQHGETASQYAAASTD